MLTANTQGAWSTLLTKVQSFVGRRVPADDVDDVVQEVLLRIHRGAGAMRDDERFGPWVYRVARNATVDHLRARRRSPFVQDGDALEAAGSLEHDDEREELRMLERCVAGFVGELPAPYREAIVLVELEGLTQKAAAEIAGVTHSGMKSRVQRGRRALLAMFTACCDVTLDARGRIVDAQSASDGGGCTSDGCT